MTDPEVLLETAYAESPHASELREVRVLFEHFPNVMLVQIGWIIGDHSRASFREAARVSKGWGSWSVGLGGYLFDQCA